MKKEKSTRRKGKTCNTWIVTVITGNEKNTWRELTSETTSKKSEHVLTAYLWMQWSVGTKKMKTKKNQKVEKMWEGACDTRSTWNQPTSCFSPISVFSSSFLLLSVLSSSLPFLLRLAVASLSSSVTRSVTAFNRIKSFGAKRRPNLEPRSQLSAKCTTRALSPTRSLFDKLSEERNCYQV